eukprot:scaffold1219_cov400-Prasinococcus_capsulatus_cf.AAC.4
MPHIMYGVARQLTGTHFNPFMMTVARIEQKAMCHIVRATGKWKPEKYRSLRMKAGMRCRLLAGM